MNPQTFHFISACVSSLFSNMSQFNYHQMLDVVFSVLVLTKQARAGFLDVLGIITRQPCLCVTFCHWVHAEYMNEVLLWCWEHVVSSAEWYRRWWGRCRREGSGRCMLWSSQAEAGAQHSSATKKIQLCQTYYSLWIKLFFICHYSSHLKSAQIGRASCRERVCQYV